MEFQERIKRLSLADLYSEQDRYETLAQRYAALADVDAGCRVQEELPRKREVMVQNEINLRYTSGDFLGSDLWELPDAAAIEYGRIQTAS